MFYLRFIPMKRAKYPARPGMSLERPKKYLSRFGQSRTDNARKVESGKAPYPVSIGAQGIALPDYVADDYLRHLMESEKPFNAEAYLKKIGGRVVAA
jgi:hypothetical protein